MVQVFRVISLHAMPVFLVWPLRAQETYADDGEVDGGDVAQPPVGMLGQQPLLLVAVAEEQVQHLPQLLPRRVPALPFA